MQQYCRGAWIWRCVALVLIAPATGKVAPITVPEDGQDRLSEKLEGELGMDDEQYRKEGDDDVWVEVAAPQVKYNYWEDGREVTDSGKPEAPQAIDRFVPEIHPVLPKERGNIPCDEECKHDEYCWEGHCLYRPWKYQSRPKYTCYPDPSQPGLTLEEKLACRAKSHDKTTCLKNKYCKWLADAPMWYKPFIETWHPPPPHPKGLWSDAADAAENFIIAGASSRDVTGAQPLTRAEKRANARDEYVGGTNNLPYDERSADDARAWRDLPHEPMQPMYYEESNPDGPKKQYPTNTTGPRFLANATDPYWYATPSNQEKFEDMDEKAAEEAAEKEAEEAGEAAPGPAPAPVASPAANPGPGPAPVPAPAAEGDAAASPAFLEIQHIRRHPYV